MYELWIRKLILKWFGLISSLVAFFSQVSLYVFLSLSRLIPPDKTTKKTTNVSSLSSIFYLISVPPHKTDKWLCLASPCLLALIIYELYFIISQALLLPLAKRIRIAAHFMKILSRRIPDNKILLVKQTFEHFHLSPSPPHRAECVWKRMHWENFRPFNYE